MYYKRLFTHLEEQKKLNQTMKEDTILKDKQLLQYTDIMEDQKRSIQVMKDRLLAKEEQIAQLEKINEEKQNQILSLESLLVQEKKQEPQQQKSIDTSTIPESFQHTDTTTSQKKMVTKMKNPSEVIGKNKYPEIVFITDSVGKHIDQQKNFGRKKVYILKSPTSDISRNTFTKWLKLDSV